MLASLLYSSSVAKSTTGGLTIPGLNLVITNSLRWSQRSMSLHYDNVVFAKILARVNVL